MFLVGINRNQPFCFVANIFIYALSTDTFFLMCYILPNTFPSEHHHMLDEKRESNLNMDQFCDLLSPIQSQSWKSARRRRRDAGTDQGSLDR